MTFEQRKIMYNLLWNLSIEDLELLKIGFTHTKDNPIKDDIIRIINIEIKYFR